MNRLDLIQADEYVNSIQRDLEELKGIQAVGASTFDVKVNTEGEWAVAEGIVPQDWFMGGGVLFFPEEGAFPYAELIPQIFINDSPVQAFNFHDQFRLEEYGQVKTHQGGGLLSWAFNLNNYGPQRKFTIKFKVVSTAKGTIDAALITPYLIVY